MYKGIILRSASFALLSLFIFSCAPQMYSKEDAIAERRKLMKATSKANKALKKAIKAKDFATVEAKAREIAANMEEVPNLFPKGSTAKNSRAKAAIWKKWKSFTGNAKSNNEVALLLASAAAAKDGNKVKTLAKGIKCKGCHKPFRKPKKKKKRM